MFDRRRPVVRHGALDELQRDALQTQAGLVLAPILSSCRQHADTHTHTASSSRIRIAATAAAAERDTDPRGDAAEVSAGAASDVNVHSCRVERNAATRDAVSCSAWIGDNREIRRRRRNRRRRRGRHRHQRQPHWHRQRSLRSRRPWGGRSTICKGIERGVSCIVAALRRAMPHSHCKQLTIFRGITVPAEPSLLRSRRRRPTAICASLRNLEDGESHWYDVPASDKSCTLRNSPRSMVLGRRRACNVNRRTAMERSFRGFGSPPPHRPK